MLKKFLGVILLVMSCMSDVSATSNDDFCWRYFDTLDHNENIFYSPYGIHSALSILANGASGETQQEILSTLNATNIATLNADNIKFSTHIQKSYRDENIFIETNLLLVDEASNKSGINKNFKHIIANDYKSDVHIVDFKNNIDDVKKMIASFVSEKTSGFIPDYKSIATADTITDFLNVVYFKGKWKFPFKANATERKPFTNRDGSKVNVDMMFQKFYNDISYHADEKFRAIKLPYSANAEMFVIMPREESSLQIADLWNAENNSVREKFLGELSTSTPSNAIVKVRLPKFEVDLENNLVKNFKAMGLVRSFSDDAEFFNILNDTQLKIGNANQRAKIRVDEAGTEAATVTEIVMVGTTAFPSIHEPEVIKFFVERPFLFIIRDIKYGELLFVGIINTMEDK